MIDRLRSINTINNRPIQKDQRQVEFKGRAGNLSAKMINWAGKFEASPFLELLIIDLFGMIIPRTLIDLNRNKKDLGHLNWDAGRETSIRESATAVLLYFFPGFAAYGLGNTLLKSRFINKEGLDTKSMRFSFLNAAEKHFGIDELEKSKDEIKNNKEDILSFKKDLIGKLFGEARPEIRSNYTMTDGFNVLKNDFVDKLKEMGDEKVQKDFAKSLSEYFKEASLKVVYQDENKNKKLVSSISHFIRDLNDISTTLMEKALEKALEKAKKLAIENAKPGTKAEDITIKKSDFAKQYKILSRQLEKLKYAKLALGIGAGMISLVAFPKLNIWISKKTSFKENFPGTNGLIDNELPKAEEVKI